MEGKSRNILVILIILVIAVAVFSSFGMDMFTPASPPITLPPVEESRPGGETPEDDPNENQILVFVTPETVQNVIATLARPSSYYCQVTVEYSESGGRLTAEQWVDGGWSKTDATLPSGTVRHSIVGEEWVYYWYGNSRTWTSAPADAHSADLEGPHIPTYEDVLAEKPACITAADYVEKNGMACIYIAVEDPELGSVSRYWISVESGLLAAAEQVKEDRVVLSMTATAAERPVAPGQEFSLPDGTVLHTVQTAA